MSSEDVERLIEENIEDATAKVGTPRAPDPDEEDAHFAAVVVSPAFEGETLVDQHRMVYDAVGEAMTNEVHALEIETYSPEAYAEHGDGTLDVDVGGESAASDDADLDDSDASTGDSDASAGDSDASAGDSDA